MKILYDYQMFSIQKFGGITRYFCEIIKNLPPEIRFQLALLCSENHHLKENRDVFKKVNILPEQNFKGKYYLQKIISSINKSYSQQCISANKFDLFHPTFYDNYFFKFLKKKYIITVHDLILFKFDDTFYKSDPRKIQMENVIKNASRIIAISENTKKDIIEFFEINPEKIDVIHHGFITTGSHERVNNFGKYILFVGQRSRHKNFTTFANAVSKILQKDKELKLICVGKPFDASEIEILLTLDITKQVSAINVDDRTLNDLYSYALAFVYPSLYEGFGMPILEAFANNCPVCLSNTSSFPEVAGDAGVYFDPLSQDSMLAAMEKVIYDDNYAKELVNKGQVRLKDFSWQKAARETVDSYTKTINLS